MAIEDGTIITRTEAGWAGDVFYTVKSGEQEIEVDAFTAGSGLLMPGETINFSEPEVAA